MAAQVASAPTRTNNKNKKLPSGLGPELNSGKSGGGGGGGGGTVQRTGPMLGAGDGTLNNVDHHRRNELNMVHSTSTTHSAPDGRDKDGNHITAASASTNSTTSSMETGLIANHKLKCAGSGDPPQSQPLPQQQQQQQQQPPQFGQFAPHQQRQIQSNNTSNNNGQGPRGDRAMDHQHHGGKENLLGGQGEPQQPHMPGKGEGELTCKPAERMAATRYEHPNLGPTTNNSEFNNNYYTPRPCYEQHGGGQQQQQQQQQSGGMGITHSSAHNRMENSHEAGFHNSQYNQYPAYRASYGGGAYGMMGPSGCRQPGNMMGSNSSASHGKSPLGAGSGAGFQRFPGPTQQQQQQQHPHPSGATPTLNQLLTSPSPMMRGYGSAYQDYSGPAAQQQAGMGLGKDVGPQYGPASAHGWGGQQRNHPHPMSPGNGGQGLGRAQVSSMDFMAMKRSQLYGMANNPYSTPQQPGGGPYPPSQPYTSPPPHRYPMGMQGRSQMGMGGMQYPQQQQVAPYGQQVMGGYSQQQQQQQQAGQQGTPPYFSPPQQTPPGPTQSPYLQPRPPPQQEAQQESYNTRGSAPGNSGKANNEDSVSQDRPSSLPDLSGSIDDLPTGTEAGLGSAVNAGGSSSSSSSSSQGEQGGAGNQGQSPFSPHASPHLPSQRSGPSPSPVGSPAGSTQSQQSRSGSGPISPASGPSANTAAPGSNVAPQSSGNGPDGAHPPIPRSPMAQERGFLSNMQRNQAGSQFASPQSGPSMSPHPSPGGPLYPGMVPYSQSGPAGPYGHQGSQYGHQGNYPRPSNYSGAASTSYSGPGPGMTNSLGMNASSPMHGQGPGQPIPVGRSHGPGSQNRVYPPMAPSSPSMPQPAGPGMGPPSLGSSNRKAQEAAAAGMAGSANSTHTRRPAYVRSPAQMQPTQPTSSHWPAPHPACTRPHPSPPPRPHHPSILPPSHSQHRRQGSYPGPGVSQASTMATTVPYSQPTGNNSSAMGNAQGPAYMPPSGPMAMSGDGMVSPDGKPKTDVKDDTGPANEPHKPKLQDGYSNNNSSSGSQQCVSQPTTPGGALPVPSPLSPSPASLSSYHGDDSDSISSPPWPLKTPSSPKANPNASTLSGERIARLYELGAEPERRGWVERYLTFMEERGTPVAQLPTVGKKPLDLWRLYIAVREIGGLAMVNKNKKWRELSTALSVGTSSSSASSLKKQYIQYLFAYECKMERGEEPPADSSNSNSSSGGGSVAGGENRKQVKIQPPSPANSGGSLQGPQTPQSSGSSSTAEAAGDLKPPTPATTPLGQVTPLPPNRSSVSVQDPFSEVSDPAFQKRAASLPPSAPYQQGLSMPDMMMRMQYDAKDPFAGMRKMAGADPYIPGQMPGGGMQDMYGRPPSALSMSQRSQYPYGQGFDRRPDHVMGMEGSMGPPGSQNNLGPSNSEGSMYSPSRYPSQQRHDGYGQQYPSMPYGMHPSGMYPQQQGYKRPMDGMYGPPPKRHESDMYAMQYANQQPDVYNHYSGGYSGPEHRALQGQFPYPYPRDRMGPSGQSQHSLMGGGPTPNHAADGPNMWPSRTDIGYPYPNRQGPAQMPPYGSIGRDDMDVRPGQEQWHRQSYMSSSGGMTPLSSRQPSSYSNSPSMANHLPRAPSPGAFQRSLDSRMSPSKVPFMSPMKMHKPSMAMMGSQGSGSLGQFPPNLRRDLNYPPGSVEATMPVLKPRRKLISKDTGTPEAWRVMMSLKSGLLAESTWALDTINILLYDDSTVASFNLAQLPGFLELVVEYFRRCLIEIFGILEEFEVGTVAHKSLLDPPSNQKEEEPIHDQETDSAVPPESESASGVETQVEQTGGAAEEAPRVAAESESAVVNGEKEECAAGGKKEDKNKEDEDREEKEGEESKNGAVSKKESVDQPVAELEPKPQQASKYDKLPIKIVQKEDLIEDMTERLGYVTEFTSGLLHWQAGGGDSTSHIQTHFEPRTAPPARADEKIRNESRQENTAEDGKKQAPKHITATIDDVLCARVDALSYAHPARSLPSYPFRVHPDGEKDHITLLEDEPRCLDEAPLSTLSGWQDSLSKRCLCVSNIVRSLSFIPGNDSDMSRHPALVLLLGRLLLLHHQHPERNRSPPGYQRDEQRQQGLSSSKEEWWWECLSLLRENAMVTMANISGQLDLSTYSDTICLPVLDGLLHWMVCPSAEAQDPFPSAAPHSLLTPQRLVLECLCKLSIQDGNVDLLLATPPFSRQEKLFTVLVRYVGQRKAQVYREMAVAVLSHLAQGDPTAARAIAMQKGSVGNLVGFLEDGVSMAQYQQNPHSLLHMGHPPMDPPSINMMCRAAKGLLAMAKVEENKTEFVLYESRLLDISISSVLSAGVVDIICQVLFHLGKL
ncbi:AT-rich interactive domain-containing protein 1B-like isoform X2 [Scophthalmus maximus]|uniref:AT-rich interactive domain-containing protein 1B-like isoform X2 n=1 Tax=Scophthalmus maximus TaxID=52904 RepID=UPI001FA8F915|nr:AT-rich interactive domain-containing protein 1B-like isoform X2 [Scophthalmus maximus]